MSSVAALVIVIAVERDFLPLGFARDHALGAAKGHGSRRHRETHRRERTQKFNMIMRPEMIVLAAGVGGIDWAAWHGG